jgi:chromosome partitioning protein
VRLALANLKGGTGKTTAAVHLALGLSERGRTLLVDADPQGSALAWSEQASDFPVTVIHWPTRDLARRVGQVDGDYAHIVIDTPPGLDGLVRQALFCADVLLVPLAPSLLEIARLGPTFEAAAEVEALHPVSVRVVLVRVRAGTRSARDARIALEASPPEGLGVPTLKAEVHLRESYATAYGLIPPDLGEYRDVLAELLNTDQTGGVKDA